MAPNTVVAGSLPADATVTPTSGYAGANLVATYSFTPKSSCSAYHGQVSWSFGSTTSWATSPVPSTAGTRCTSSTPSLRPPAGLGPGSYQVCGTDPPVSSTPACATYTIKAPASTPPPRPSPSPQPSPRASPPASAAPSASPSPSAAPGTVGGTPSPPASPVSQPTSGGDGDGSTTLVRSDSGGGISLWPWTAVLIVLALITGVWRFRSWLVGVFENVEVMGKSGADLETELLHHDASPPTPDEAEAPPWTDTGDA